MKIDKSLHDDHAVLTLKGEFDTFYCPMLQQEVEALVERGVSHLLVDMRLVKFINSTALGAIIKAHKRCRAEAGELVISQPSNFVRDVITKVGIDKLIPMFETEQEATKAIIKHLNQRELTGEAPVDHEKILVSFPDETRQKIATLVRDLGNVDWEKRQTATEELAEYGFMAKSLMLEALKVTPDPEVRRRIEKLLGEME